MEETLEQKLEELTIFLKNLQAEIEEIKDDSEYGLRSKYKELSHKVEKIEGNLGVDKIIITDTGDKVQITVQTPLGSVLAPLAYTANVAKAISNGSSTTAVSHQPAMKGAPAGMTAEQLQDFKKQSLQINTLQQKVKELETKLTEANSVIKKDREITTNIEEKEIQDVKEIYLYLDNINNTMSEKIANQRIEMEKLAGDTPQLINYDPFNYGEAYGGDVVDFQARKRIMEIELLLQGLQMAMNQMKDSVHVSQSIDLGYKVVRLDQLIESTGFGQAIRSGECTRDNCLLINQAQMIDLPELRYPRKEMFQTNDDKESNWAVTDSIMQTMYRMESELGDLQKLVGSLDVASNFKVSKEPVSSAPQHKESERGFRAMLEKEVQGLMQTVLSNSMAAVSADKHLSGTGQCNMTDHIIKDLNASIQDLKARLKMLEWRQNNTKGNSAARERSNEMNLPSMPRFSPFTFPRLDSYYKQPVRLRAMLQRIYTTPMTDSPYDVYRIPRPCGRGYTKPWPRPYAYQGQRLDKVMPEIVKPVSEDFFIRGKDNRYYRGDSASHPSVSR